MSLRGPYQGRTLPDSYTLKNQGKVILMFTPSPLRNLLLLTVMKSKGGSEGVYLAPAREGVYQILANKVQEHQARVDYQGKARKTENSELG